MDVGVISVRYARALLKSAVIGKQEDAMFDGLLSECFRTATYGKQPDALQGEKARSYSYCMWKDS